MDASPPPLSCLGTSNAYNIDIGHSVWNKSNGEDIFSTDSAKNVCKPDEEVCFEKLGEEISRTREKLSSNDEICGNSDNVHSETDNDRTLDCNYDVDKSDSDDDFGDFEGTITCSIKPIEYSENKDKLDYDKVTDNINENQQFNEIKIPTIYSDNDDEFNDFHKSKDDSGDDFTAFANIKEDSDDDFEFGTFTTFDSFQGSLKSNDSQVQSRDDKTDASSELTLDPNQATVLTKAEEIHSHSNELLDKLDCLIYRWIGNTMKKENNVDVSILCDYVEEDAFIWHHLIDVESSQALKLNWNNLISKKHFLNSLDVDARNILYKSKWNASIPIFAQTLSFSPLTPARFKEKHGNNGSENVMQILPKEISKQEPKIEGVIPPAKFDWSSSGLTNPLETPGIEKEILTSGPNEMKIDQPNIIQRLMESRATTNKVTPISAMKPGVQKIISQLPDISFMKAKVFMFPINQS